MWVVFQTQSLPPNPIPLISSNCVSAFLCLCFHAFATLCDILSYFLLELPFRAGIFLVHFYPGILCYLGKRGDFKLHKAAILSIFFANKVGAESVGMDEVYARGLSCLVHVGHVRRRDQLLIKRLLLLQLLHYDLFTITQFFTNTSSVHHNLACQERDQLLIKQASDPTSSVRPLHH